MIDFSPFFISMQVAFSATFISIFLGMGLCYLSFYYPQTKTFLDIGLTLPMVLPPTVIGLLLLILFGNNSFIGNLLSDWGISVIFNIYGAILAATVVSLPLFFKTVVAGVETIDQDMLNVGRTLGMSEFELFCKIILPQIYPVFFTGSVLTFARALGEFGATLMIAGNIPGRTHTMSIAIYTAIQSGNHVDAYLWGGVIVSFALVTLILLKIFNKTK